MTPPPPDSLVLNGRTTTILTIPTLLHRGAAEPLGPFGGRLSFEVRLLAIFRSCSTADPCLRAGNISTMYAVPLDGLVFPGSQESTGRS